MGEVQRRCRWVRDRLPLLDGGELATRDRRKAEQHLILCAECRARHASLRDALGMLHAAAALPPVGSDSAEDVPSLWPALARQIRESRHEPAGPRLTDPSTWAIFRSAPLLGAAWAAAFLLAAGVGLWAHVQVRDARARMGAATHAAAFPAPPIAPAPSILPPAEAPLPDSGVVLSDPGVAPADLSSASNRRLDFDLEHGTPMARDGRDARATYSY